MLDGQGLRTKLCVLTPVIGSASETFVRGHIEDVLPGSTSAICLRRAPAVRCSWTVAGPVLELEGAAPFLHRAFRRLLRLTLLRGAEKRRIVEFLKAHHVEAVMIEYLDIACAFQEAVEAAGVRVYAHGLGYDVSARLRDPKWVERYQALNRCDGIIVVSTHFRDRLIKIGLDAEKIAIIPCGSHYKTAWRERQRGPQFRIVAVGRLVPKKAPPLTIQAFANALSSCPNARLDLIGDGPLVADCEQLIAKLGLGEKVVLHGSRPHAYVTEIMDKADLFVQHSMVDPASGDEEGLPVAVLEAMSCGLPVVSTRHAGIPDAVVEGQTGILVDEGDVHAMADGIAAFCASHDMCLQYGRAGFHRVQEGFSFDVERRRLIEFMGVG